MTSLRVNIMATKRRERWVRTMLYLLNEDFEDRVNVYWDEKGDLWEGAKGALMNYKSFNSHNLIIQDDVLPSKDLIKVAEQLIELLPDKPITLFSNKNVILYARAERKHWCVLKKLLMMQAYILPTAIIEDFIPWADRHLKPEIYMDDNRFSAYAHYHDLRVWATAPSLVEHVPGWNSTTLRGGYREGHKFLPEQRMAKFYIGFENSGLDIDWTKGLDKPVIDDEQIIGDYSHYYIE